MKKQDVSLNRKVSRSDATDKKRAGKIGKRYTEWPSDVDYSKHLKAILKLSDDFIDGEAVKRVTGLLERFHVFLSRFQDRQFRMVVKSKTGKDLPPSKDFVNTSEATGTHRTETWLTMERQKWIETQVNLITKLSESHRRKCLKIVSEHVEDSDTMKMLLQKQLGMSERRASLIASDQYTKGAEALNRIRYQELGAITYRWISKRDNRVRPTHQARDGVIFSFASVTHPGLEIGCRCHAEPIFPDDIKDPILEMD